MKQQGFPLYFVVTATTRPQRKGEENGKDYHFLSPEEFQRKVEQGEFLEWAEVYGNWYGVPKEQIREALARGEDVILKVDVQGAATIKRLVPQAVFIFLTPPSLEELEQRLQQRKSESRADLELRIKKAREEMRSLPLFDYMVVNHQDKLDLTVSQLQAIVLAEKCRVKPREVKLP
jgi:guanylate kinase